jgi:hypothetical protein
MTSAGWAPAFLGTLALEVPVYLWTTRSVFAFRQATLIALTLNFATHPLAWAALASVSHPFPKAFFGVEAVVWVTEAALLKLASVTRFGRRPLSWQEALVISFAANGLSAGVGLLF